jgi:hypothetical protein
MIHAFSPSRGNRLSAIETREIAASTPRGRAMDRGPAEPSRQGQRRRIQMPTVAAIIGSVGTETAAPPADDDLARERRGHPDQDPGHLGRR